MTSQNCTILEGGQSRPPLQRVLDRPCGSCEKPPRFPSYAVGADGRYCIGFLFLVVGADDSVRPPETPVFTEILCESETFQWADVGIGPYMRWYFRFHTVGVDAYIDPSHRPNGNAPRGGGRTLLHWVSISRRRGGRPCPPAGIARFHGNPMRIRNFLMGRCGHRPLHEVVFPIPYRRGRCLHRPAGNAGFMAVFRRIHVDFPFRAVGADDSVRPPGTPVLWRFFRQVREIAIPRHRGRKH